MGKIKQDEFLQEINMQVEQQTIDLTKCYDPRTNEKQMLFHAAPETYKLYGGAMGGGKTGALINEGNQLSLDYPGNFGLLIRRTWPSFRDTVLPQVEKFIDSRMIANWNRSEKYIIYKNSSKIRYGGMGDRPDDWEKWMSGEYGWIAIDQAEQFTELEFRMLATRLRLKLPGIRYFFLLSCNPNIGWIKEIFVESNLEDHIFVPALPEDNLANLPVGYIGRMRGILTPKQQKALLEGNWEAITEPDNVFAYTEIQKAAGRSVEASEPVQIGADIARGGDDETVIILREGLKIRIYNRAQGHDLMKTTGLIWKCCQDKIIPKWGDKLNKITIKIDADGIGAGVVDRLMELKSEKEGLYTDMILKIVDKERREELNKQEYRMKIKIVEIHGAAKAKEPAIYKNQRAEIHWGMRELLPDLDLPPDRELQTQLMAIKYKINSAGQIMIVPKEDIKKKLGRSPDSAEGVIYSLADVRPKIEVRIR